jgi:hypothetical protein
VPTLTDNDFFIFLLDPLPIFEKKGVLFFEIDAGGV